MKGSSCTKQSAAPTEQLQVARTAAFTRVMGAEQHPNVTNTKF